MTVIYRITLVDGTSFAMLDPVGHDLDYAWRNAIDRFGRHRVAQVERQTPHEAPHHEHD